MEKILHQLSTTIRKYRARGCPDAEGDRAVLAVSGGFWPLGPPKSVGKCFGASAHKFSASGVPVRPVSGQVFDFELNFLMKIFERQKLMPESSLRPWDHSQKMRLVLLFILVEFQPERKDFDSFYDHLCVLATCLHIS